MLTIRCTRKLLRHLEADVTSETELPTTIFGDWYANVFFTKRRRLIIAISERTLLPGKVDWDRAGRGDDAKEKGTERQSARSRVTIHDATS
jgi:hypothetical protein